MDPNKNYLNDWDEIKCELVKYEHFAKMFNDFEDISYEEAKKLDKNIYTHAAHAFIFSKTDKKLWSFELNAFILMQNRFDGFIGFPGGLIDKTDNSWEEGLNRELHEEINLNTKYSLNEKNYFFSTLNSERKLVLHFYLLEVSNEEYLEIEKDTLDSHDWGGEVLGIIRPPLFELNRPGGLQVFLKNQFIGNSLIQLIRAIIYLDILPKNTLIRSIYLSRQ